MIAVDTLTFRTEVMPIEHTAVGDGPPNGVFVYGLYLEGAFWDRETSKLAEMPPGMLFCPMPVIWLDPVVASELDPGNAYVCPVYKTARRAGTLSTTGHSTN